VAVERLNDRQPAELFLPVGPHQLHTRCYIPALRLQLFGEGPELEALVAFAGAAGVEVAAHGKDALSLGRRPAGLAADPWTAVVLLFHDHEWEQPILEWALDTRAFHIGAQGGFEARRTRLERLAERRVPSDQLSRIKSPIGVITHSREPGVLALSVLAEIVGEYEALHPHG
jgi:xanthine dehydrogenase accessory factor